MSLSRNTNRIPFTPAIAFDLLVGANLTSNAILLVGALWSVALPSRRIYPLERKGPAYYLMWILFTVVFASNGALAVLDWNTGPWTSNLRFALALPVAGLGAAFVTWGIATLGVKNTSALRDRFVAAGPYLISRNPQYVGDFLLFVGISIAANSPAAWVTHLLASLVLLLAPFAEEPWLEEQYGSDYREYRQRVPRYL